MCNNIATQEQLQEWKRISEHGHLPVIGQQRHPIGASGIGEAGLIADSRGRSVWISIIDKLHPWPNLPVEIDQRADPEPHEQGTEAKNRAAHIWTTIVRRAGYIYFAIDHQ